ncbi:MAG: hypothetical protein K1X94_26580 [Sandaracinaceae bacterium]|jgi:hypothetical protein|nr:hypothetical protein [Sandaracinaceae bacterium]
MRHEHDDKHSPPRKRRKLLVATVGLATLSLVGCGSVTSGNLIAPPPTDAGVDTGNAPDDAGATDDAR